MLLILKRELGEANNSLKDCLVIIMPWWYAAFKIYNFEPLVADFVSEQNSVIHPRSAWNFGDWTVGVRWSRGLVPQFCLHSLSIFKPTCGSALKDHGVVRFAGREGTVPPIHVAGYNMQSDFVKKSHLSKLLGVIRFDPAHHHQGFCTINRQQCDVKGDAIFLIFNQDYVR